MSQILRVGEVIHGFKLVKTAIIKELNITPYLLRHSASGAEHLHIENKDSNNLFAVSFRTAPKDSTGLPHILEHLTLCGSMKYPVRDPFMKMLTRSLATYMNALTGPDFTAYPFSTQNKQDFENLRKIYLDAVFFPRLRPVDFRQEGWRLEHDIPDKKDTPIILRGVVYNEMKGVFSSSSSIYGRQLLNNLFPDTAYGHESGGDPEHIPDLIYDDLKKFHQTHYHPSNAKFFTYGDIPLEEHLKFMNESILCKFSENPLARERSIVQEQPKWTKPKNIEITCPPDPLSANPEKQSTTSIAFMLPVQSIDSEEIFALNLLESLLIDGPSSPFHKNLIESGLGSDYSPSTGLAAFTKQPYFSVGLQNIHPGDISKVHQIIEQTLTEASQQGFPDERVEALLHNIELNLKHVRGNFGLRLLMNLESVWNHDGDVVEHLNVDKFMSKFRQDLARNKQYWSDLIHKHFLSNNHKLIFTMNPDSSFVEKRNEREMKILETKVTNLSEIDRKRVLYEGMELMKLQDSKDDINILPCLSPTKDISRDLPYRTDLKFIENNIQLCEQPTNEVVYFRAVANIGDRLEKGGLLDYLPLFCEVATKLGAGSLSRHDLAQKIQLTTGGLGIAPMVTPSLIKFDDFSKQICFGSHCLRRNISEMFDLWANVLQRIHFDENKGYLNQLIKASVSNLTDGIAHSAQSYAIKRAASSLAAISALDERLSGLSFVDRMRKIASEEKIDDIARKLQRVANIALDPSNMRCAINAEPEAMQNATDNLRNFLDRANAVHKDISIDDDHEEIIPQEKSEPEIKFPFSTHFVAQSYATVPKAHEDHAKLIIMSKLVSSKYLLREVREKGGAYGAGARLSNSGMLNFYSYRDPNTIKTLETFGRSAEWLVSAGGYGDQEVEESKLGVFQDVDRPVEPGQRGVNYFISGETDDMREQFRRRLLDVTKDDVSKVAKKYLMHGQVGTYVI